MEVVKHVFLTYKGYMRISLILFFLCLSSLSFAQEESSPSISMETDESVLDKTLEKEEASAQKFAELVKSTMELMGPENEHTSEEQTSPTPIP
jgi:hypothetical protein